VVAMMPWEYEAVVGNLVDRQVNRRPVDFLDVYALSHSAGLTPPMSLDDPTVIQDGRAKTRPARRRLGLSERGLQ
jgi:hypothetical protein